MRSFIWILPVILLISVVAMAYFLGVAQDRAKKAIINQTGLNGLGSQPKPTDISKSDKSNLSLNPVFTNNTQ